MWSQFHSQSYGPIPKNLNLAPNSPSSGRIPKDVTEAVPLDATTELNLTHKLFTS